MSNGTSPCSEMRMRVERRETTPRRLAEEALARANRNQGKNVYLALDAEWTAREADRIEAQGPRNGRRRLFGLPVSLKDCFDLQGFQTTAGARFYAETNRPAERDSAVAARLRAEGAVITGKTHLHPLAYGITGENPDFGDCRQPLDEALLTGGSTSGGAASVQEGSAVAAIGTDTGGSIRVPAALCGLAGYRASIGLAQERNLWAGGVHLAQSFDTLGWIFRDLRDGPLLAEGLFGLRVPETAEPGVRIGMIARSFVGDCDASVAAAMERSRELFAASGAHLGTFEAHDWEEALSIYAPIQGNEAAAIHRPATHGDFSRFPPRIAELLARGAAVTGEELQKRKQRHAGFRARVDQLFQKYDFLSLPCALLSRLEAGKDHSETRMKILRYTVPLSLAGTPVVTLPFAGGAGMQLAAARGEDAKLLAYAAHLGARMASG
jgi:Asp-tRNA(Asn)/Glu-tRNA(Gln) amidotransferase A subunit family amidase